MKYRIYLDEDVAADWKSNTKFAIYAGLFYVALRMVKNVFTRT
jgi:hypothetical protein